MTQKGYLVGVVAVIQRDDGKVAMGLRVVENVWAGFGGKLEAGETPEAGLRREVLEEAGVELGPLAPLGFRTGAKADGTPFVMLYFLGQPQPRQEVRILEPLVFGELRWFDLDALPGNLWPRERDILSLVPRSRHAS